MNFWANFSSSAASAAVIRSDLEPGPIYEFACHEGNYALPNMLGGHRASKR